MESMIDRLEWLYWKVKYEVLAKVDSSLERINKWSNEEACDLQNRLSIYEYEHGKVK